MFAFLGLGLQEIIILAAVGALIVVPVVIVVVLLARPPGRPRRWRNWRRKTAGCGPNSIATVARQHNGRPGPPGIVF